MSTPIEQNTEGLEEILRTVNALPNAGGGSGSCAAVETFTTKPIGQLFDQPANYSFWCPQTLAYDPSIDKYVDLIFGTTNHLAADNAHTLWVSYIDPKTYEATEPVQCVYMDGETTLTMPDAGCAAFIILDDGRYMQINRPSSASNDMYLFFSEDNGKTWVKGDKAAGFSTTMEVYYLTKLSNGRLLANSTANKVINYSDNGGLNWKGVTPTTCGGNMESEIFFAEVKPGVVIAIGRYSMSGIGYNASGDSQHAVISFSEDYGTTWTPWKLSETIDNMNASCCTGYLHDGLLELFCGSRWYYNGNNANTDYTNTGKTGAITHYTATVENALADNFTNAGVVVYAKAQGNASSQDFHTPCVAVNGKEMLMVYADRVYPYTTESTNHYFVRGYLGDSMDYAPNDEIVSSIFPYSSKKVRELLMLQKSELIVLMNEAIMSNKPVAPDDVAVYATDGLVMYFNMTDGSKYDAENLTVTDVVHGLTANLIGIVFDWTALTELPEIREKSVPASIYFKTSNPLAEYITDEDTAFTLEWSMYQYSDLPQHPTDGWALRSETYKGMQFYGQNCGTYLATDGTTYKNVKDGLSAAGQEIYTHKLFPYGVTDTHRHCVMTFDSDGTVRWYKDGVKMSEAVMPDFLQWDRTYLTKGFRMGGNCRAMRIYKRALSDEEVRKNYEYEKQFFV